MKENKSGKAKTRKKLKTETITQTIGDALQDAKSEVSMLAEEMTGWRDNMDGTGLENTAKYEEVSEAANTLEDLDSRLQGIEIKDDIERQREITYHWSHPYGRHIGRGWRAGMVATALNAILEVLPDEDDSRGELEDIATEVESLEFPTMYSDKYGEEDSLIWGRLRVGNVIFRSASEASKLALIQGRRLAQMGKASPNYRQKIRELEAKVKQLEKALDSQ